VFCGEVETDGDADETDADYSCDGELEYFDFKQIL
jgi:hypothetical protein